MELAEIAELTRTLSHVSFLAGFVYIFAETNKHKHYGLHLHAASGVDQ